MEHLFTREWANVTSWTGRSVVVTARFVNRSKTGMIEADMPKVGMVYRSQRTGRALTVTAVENDRIYYEVEGFKTMSPLFLPADKFIHLVGLDQKPE